MPISGSLSASLGPLNASISFGSPLPSVPSNMYYQRDSHSAQYNFNQTARSLFVNQPRFPFEYYVNFNFNNVGTAKTYIANFFTSSQISQIMPLVKTVDMPSMKIETTPLNQYNRKRLSQTKIAFEPVKMVFHDVCDGKTLKLWDMYYRYYFADGNEPGQNQAKNVQQSGLQDPGLASPPPSSTNTTGDKSTLQNIVSDTLNNQNFGFNLPTVQNVRNLIQSIDIFQVHGGKFNQVRLVNPRISAFTHDVLNYAVGDKTLEITFMFDYEYSYYVIQNMELGGIESNNDSSIEPFTHSQFLELTNLAFTQFGPDFLQSNNPLLNGANPLTFNPVVNLQANLNVVTGQFISSVSTSASTSSLGGLIDITPQPVFTPSTPVIDTRPFANTGTPDNDMYPGVNLTGNS